MGCSICFGSCLSAYCKKFCKILVGVEIFKFNHTFKFLIRVLYDRVQKYGLRSRTRNFRTRTKMFL